ncbi:MAG: DinB family protein [Phycisphaerales bacterium]|nr:DinB family protein [Phycisphaerales bacterium]
MTTATSSLAETITRTLERTAGLAGALLEGVKAEDFARMPKADGKTINTNHPAFVYGHLSLYPKTILDLLGKDSSAIDHPAKFSDLFMHGVDCQDDPDSTIYPDMETIVSYFKKAHEAVIEAIKGLDDDTLNAPFSGDGWYVEFAKTPASLCIFMLHDHYMFHLGQMSAWRRCFGLGHAM